ncbi:MAG: hypothetical protein WAT79_07695 [Saprospiraceae bacterium]
MMNNLVDKLVRTGLSELVKPKQTIPFTNNEDWNIKLSDLCNYPHLFVLGCISDKQIKADRAWRIPMIIGEQIGSHEFSAFRDLTFGELEKLFQSLRLHIYNNRISKEYFMGIKRISEVYEGRANFIWEETNSSTSIFIKFLNFEGIGQKIASMAVNSLYRDFKINIDNPQWIDVSPDRHVVRVFKRTGLVENSASKEVIIWKAKELYKEYPGVFDLSCFLIGRETCHVTNPNCTNCIIHFECPKFIFNSDQN